MERGRGQPEERRAERWEWKRQARHWKSQHGRAKECGEQLRAEQAQHRVTQQKLVRAQAECGALQRKAVVGEQLREALQQQVAAGQPERDWQHQSARWQALQEQFSAAMSRFLADIASGQQSVAAGDPRLGPLTSLLHYRTGLSVCVQQPCVPMDNNRVERALRRVVIGRQLSHGSHSPTGAELQGLLLSVCSTLDMAGIDLGRWLEAFLCECAAGSRRDRSAAAGVAAVGHVPGPPPGAAPARRTPATFPPLGWPGPARFGQPLTDRTLCFRVARGVDRSVALHNPVPTSTETRKRTARVRTTLFKRTIDALEPADKSWIDWDVRITGFGVRIHPSGIKAVVHTPSN